MLAVLAAVPELAGILVMTIDPAAAAIAARHRARVCDEGARDGHTGAVAAAVRRLAAQRCGLLTVPGDIPLIEAADIRHLLAAHCEDVRRNGRAFSIVPARDQRGSNAVACSPAAAVPLRFGDDSFLPHLAAARARGIEPRVLQLARIALDIDTPDDLAQLLAATPPTRIHGLLARWRMTDASRKATA